MKTSRSGMGMRKHRTCGVAPQSPKAKYNIRIKGEKHTPAPKQPAVRASKAERRAAWLVKRRKR
jgi:hypothetical protein